MVNKSESKANPKKGSNNATTDSGGNVSKGQSGQPSAPSLPADRLNELNLNDTAVEMKNLFFTYDKSKDYLLNDITLTFPRSAIYGFLGPSGCGKTTIIKLIVGRLNPNKGTIKLNGRKRSDPINRIPGVGVGYMPQEITLFFQFTIYETLNYFAKIYGLPEDHKKKRIDFLIKFLDLPEQNRLVGVLSGGQKRRTSLAVAIIHNPPLLILDEPTVGVDPVLRERIWEHLMSLSSNEKTSILITTHYIEECRRAHTIALMRNGKLLVENSPHNLLNHFQTDNLENVFLKVCRAEDNQSEGISMPPNLAQMRANAGSGESIKGELKPMKSSSLQQRFGALCQKNLITLWRQKLLVVIEILLPVIAIIMFCLCLGKKPFDLPVGVYNEEALNTLNTSANVGKLSEDFLQAIDKHIIILHNFSTNASAYQVVEDGSMFGEIVIGKNFTNALMDRYQNKMYTTNETLKQSNIEFYGDLSDINIFQTLFITLIEANIKFMYVLFDRFFASETNNGLAPNKGALLPLVQIEAIYGSKDNDARDFVAPGLILLIAFILAIALTALSTITERKEGLLERTLVAGVKMYEILIAQILVQIFVLVSQTLLVMICVFGVFGLQNNGSYVLVAILTVLQGICGMCLGLLISAVSSTILTAVMLIVGSIVPYLVISGIVWPLEGMDKWAQYLATPLPQTYPVLSLRNIMLKGWGIQYIEVSLGYLITIAWIIVFIIGTTFLNNLRKD